MKQKTLILIAGMALAATCYHPALGGRAEG